MNIDEQDTVATGHFALACERMNAFARALREAKQFYSVRTGADIRYYENGWRLEKWVEAELDKTGGIWAAWWLDLGPHEKGWIIQSHLAVSPDLFSASIEDRMAKSATEVQRQLNAAVHDLEHALDTNEQFAAEVKKRRK